MRNLDEHTARGFDSIWRRYGSAGPTAPSKSTEAEKVFATYFSIFPLERLASAEGFELGCGNGRLAQSVALHVGKLHCIDPSPAGLAAAKDAMGHLDNVRFHEASVDAIPLRDGSQDFGYSIGVLHHSRSPRRG